MSTALAQGVTLSTLGLTSDKLQRLEKQLQQQRQQNQLQIGELAELRQNLQRLDARQKTTLKQLDELGDSLDREENELASLKARVALAQGQLAQTVAQKRVTEAQVASLSEDIRAYLNAEYRERNKHYLQLLTQSRSLSDLLIRLRYINQAGEHQNQAVQALKTSLATLKEQEAREAQKAEELRGLAQQQKQLLTSLQQKHEQQQKVWAQLKATQEGQRALALQTQAQQALTAQTINELVNSVVQERQRLEAERQRRIEEERRRRAEEARRIREAQARARAQAQRLARLRADARRRELVAREQRALQARGEQLANEDAQDQSSSQPLPAFNGSHGFPLPGGSVVVPFGSGGAPWAVLSGPSGAQAAAALDGNVIAATYYASLGWLVLLDNGSGVVTGYFGLQNVQVSVGQRVSRGTALGTTGGSHVFGPDRMAFQLRQNNVPVSPRF